MRKPTVADLLGVLDSMAPQRLAEQWDNVGLLVGNTSAGAGSILIGLDPTIALVEEAVAVGADTIITHHPVIFKPLSAIDTSSPAGRLLQKALTHDISIIGCHTNLDSAADGVNDVLAELLGLESLSPLMPSGEQQEDNTGLGRIGRYPTPLSSGEFLRRLLHVLQLEAVNIAGTMPEQIGTVAVCGGSGSDLAPVAYARGADVYLTAEVKHAMAIWARETGFAVIDGTHYATEKPATFQLAKKLGQAAAEGGWHIDIKLTETEVPPFVFVHTSLFDNTQPQRTGEKP